MTGKSISALALSVSVALLLAAPARAAMIADAAHPEAGAAPLVQQAQIVFPIPGVPVGIGLPFFFGGHDHCWYDDGWRGPGWYWCGYGYRRGLGWGGPEGYNGWGAHRYERDWHPGPGRGAPGPRRDDRRRYPQG